MQIKGTSLTVQGLGKVYVSNFRRIESGTGVQGSKEQVQGLETGVRVQCTRVPGTKVQDPETGFGVAI